MLVIRRAKRVLSEIELSSRRFTPPQSHLVYMLPARISLRCPGGMPAGVVHRARSLLLHGRVLNLRFVLSPIQLGQQAPSLVVFAKSLPSVVVGVSVLAGALNMRVVLCSCRRRSNGVAMKLLHVLDSCGEVGHGLLIEGEGRGRLDSVRMGRGEIRRGEPKRFQPQGNVLQWVWRKATVEF